MDRPGGRWFWPGCLLLALAVRMVNMGPVLGSGGVLLMGTDPYYHLRRIDHAVRHFPHLPWFDPYLGYPEGALSPYEPGFDLLIATVVRRLSPLEELSETRVMAFAALAMPFLGLLILPLYAAVARELAGIRAGRIAALIMAVLPGVYFTSQLGQVDHHVLEPLLVGVPLWAGLRLLEAPDRFRTWLVCGLSLGAGLFFWRGMILPGAFLAAAFALRGGWQAANGMTDRLTVREGPALFALAAVVGLPFAVSSPVADRLSYFMVSLLQPLVFVLLAASLLLMGLLCRALRARMRGASGGLEAAAGSLLILAGLVPFGLAAASIPGFLPNLLGGIGFLARDDGFVQAVTEQRPLFSSNDGAFSWVAAVSLYGAFFWLAPLLAWTGWRGMGRMGAARMAPVAPPPVRTGFRIASSPRPLAPDFRWLLFILWSLGTAAMAITQRRYAALFGPVYAVWLGMGLAALWPVVQAWSRARQAAVAVAGTLLVLPTLGVIAVQAVAPAQEEALLEAMAWIRIYTPETSGYDLGAGGGPARAGTPGEGVPQRGPSAGIGATPAHPEYAVLAPWSEGHHLITLAHRPNVANPFGIEWFRPGLERAARFWLAPAPELAPAMDAVGARYALVSFRLALLRDEARFLGVDPDRYALPDGSGWRPGPDFIATGAARLYLEDGIARPDAPAVDGVRLIWEGGQVAAGAPAARLAGVGAPVYKLFERVKGAWLEGQAAPGDGIEVTLSLVTPAGRRLEWRQRGLATSDGRFRIQVPYSTGGGATAGARSTGGGATAGARSTGGGATAGARSTGPVRVRWSGGEWQGEIPEAAVIEGRTVRVDIGAGGSSRPAPEAASSPPAP